MSSNQRLIWMSVFTACSMALIFFTYLMFSQRARDDVRSAGERQLQIMALDLESVLERYETLPYALSYLPVAAEVLNRPDDQNLVQQFNLTLQDIQSQAKVAAIYLMDAQGKTIAASNWGTPSSYVGKNFSFRPYFSEPFQNNSAGHFYGIGNTTNIPGYFISQPVYQVANKRVKGAAIGVIVVKISLREFEKAWRSNDDPIALTDKNGVVFLSNRDAWQYRSLRPLDAEVQKEIRTTLQYAGAPIPAIQDLLPKQRKGFGDYVSRPIGRLGWQIMLFPDEMKITRTGLQAAGIALLLMTVLAAVAGVYDQRERRLQEQRSAAMSLQKAADELEQKIVDRTRELTLANLRLESQLEKLQQTEQVLRTTQNEMVQTGKLAMLGQMAAGMTHELNQPLTAIRAFADNARVFLQRGSSEQVYANLEHISAASARMGNIIGQLKGFARKSSDTLNRVDVCLAVRASVALLSSEFERAGVQLELQMPESLMVLGDVIRTEQVLINLLRNALDAVETVAKKEIVIHLSTTDTLVNISIRDSGTGLPEDVVAHLFEPFFTTKPAGKGLGLGLAISSSIVQAMGGNLYAHNHRLGGAEFIVSLSVIHDDASTTAV